MYEDALEDDLRMVGARSGSRDLSGTVRVYGRYFVDEASAEPG